MEPFSNVRSKVESLKSFDQKVPVHRIKSIFEINEDVAVFVDFKKAGRQVFQFLRMFFPLYFVLI